MRREKLAAVFIAAAMLLGLAATAGAVDGTIEINQAKVLAGGGFPYKIITSGSYRLTGNLTVSGITDGIDVTANNVTIDLNGFTITGPGGPSTNPVGINESGGFSGGTVENGSITGFGGVGVFVGSGIVRNVRSDGNGVGIQGAANSVIEGCTANLSSLSGAPGILCSSACVISGNTANGGLFDGIDCPGGGCVISGNTANNNAASGISCGGSGCLISGNTLFLNATGISAKDATTGYRGNVLKNSVSDHNGGTSLGNNLCSGTAC
jgi:parallel beta-helix repeat protein